MGRPREFDEESVLDEALQAFWEHGYEGTSLACLMEATGLAKGSLYKGFGDKRQLFLRVLDRYLEQGRSMLCRFVTPTSDKNSDGTPRQTSGAALLQAWLEVVVSVATCSGTRRGCMAVNCSVELAHQDPEVRKVLRRHERRLEERYAQLVERGVADASLRPDLDPQRAARWLTTIINGLQVRGKLGLTKAQAQESVEMAMAGLRA